MPAYSRRFYEKAQLRSGQSGREIAPMVVRLVRPRSVVDVGCGVAAWLAAFADLGVEDLVGIDGVYIPRELLQIRPDQFLIRDLKRPLDINRRFDLVISLEVAEHLPERCASSFVASLTQLGPIILFSAAIPFQGGVHHANEQWPGYWVAQFRERGYGAIDCIRRKVWENPNVDWWYAQNALLFASLEAVDHNPLLKRELENTDLTPLSLVHPNHYMDRVDPARVSMPRLMRLLGACAAGFIERGLQSARDRWANPKSHGSTPSK